MSLAEEPIFYFLADRWYRGRQPAFYDPQTLPGTAILERHFEEIQREILAYYDVHAAEMKPNFTPYAYRDPRWTTVNLYTFFVRYPRACRQFPVTDAVVRQIPGMCLAQISVLAPHGRIKAHLDDTDAIVRSHLGISVPAPLPQLGLRVQREERGWQEGKVIAFCGAHRHRAWNDTDQPRIVLIVDVVRENCRDQAYEIAAKGLAAIAMKSVATKVPPLKRLPRGVTRSLHNVVGVGFQVLLAAQRWWSQAQLASRTDSPKSL